jgi:hypothetical protein
MIKTINVAICYDFDGTLSPTNRQENGFLLALGIQPEEFSYSNSLKKGTLRSPVESY